MQTVDRKKNTIICDLDGTIALDHKRNHFLHPPHKPECLSLRSWQKEPNIPCNCGWKRDWTSYFAACGTDEPNWPVIDLLRLYWEDSYSIHILSGRSASVADATEKWLREHAVPHHSLTLRPEGVFTDDHILKPVIAFREGWLPESVVFVLEDRQRVVDAWRAQGYTVFQVAPGKF